MRKLLKSGLVLMFVLSLVVGATGAYFTSTVTAEDNVIETGTLLLAVDFGQNNTYGGTWGTDAWNVVTENADGSMTVGSPFEAWTNVAPGDTNSYFVAIRQAGTIPAQVRFMTSGEWVSGPRFGTGSCPATPADGVASLVNVTGVELYTTNCNGDIGCRNVRDALNTGPWSQVAGLTAGSVTGPNGNGYYYGTVNGAESFRSSSTYDRYLLDEGEYVVYRIDTELDTSADSCYMGATYNFDVMVEGKQEADPAW